MTDLPPTGTVDPEDDGDDLFAVNAELVDNVEEILDREDAPALHAAIDSLHAADVADLIDILTRDQRQTFLILLGRTIAADVLTELEESVLQEVIAELTSEYLARVVADVETDDAVHILENLDPERVDSVLALVPRPERAAVLESLSYPEESAGRLMQRDLIAVPAFWTVGQVIDFCRDTDDLPDQFYEIFVVDPRHRPLGQVPLNRALRTKRPVRVRDIMVTDLVTIPVEMDQEEVAFLFQQYRMSSAPVVDEEGRLLGVITFDDVTDVVEEEAEEDLLHLAGVAGETDLYASIFKTTRTRFTWLLVNLVTAIAASLVISIFDATLEQMVALAILLPIVASMGGNAGTQTLTVAVRGLATRELTSTNALRVVAKEVAVGSLNGLFFAIIMGVVAAIWFQLPLLGVVIGLAMVFNLFVAGFFGAVIPLTCQKFNIDPAVAASIFLTTVTDIVGFFVFLGLAGLILL